MVPSSGRPNKRGLVELAALGTGGSTYKSKVCLNLSSEAREPARSQLSLPDLVAARSDGLFLEFKALKPWLFFDVVSGGL